MLRSVLQLAKAPSARPGEFLPGVLLVEDDEARNMQAALVELARRRSGRDLLERIADSGMITILVSRRLRPMLAGHWSPLVVAGRTVGAVIHIDLEQLRALDHDPSGVETLAHELRHQLDAARAFQKSGTNSAIHHAAHSGDRTGSAQRYAQRIRRERPNLLPAAAHDWLGPLVRPFDRVAATVVASVSNAPPAN